METKIKSLRQISVEINAKFEAKKIFKDLETEDIKPYFDAFVSTFKELENAWNAEILEDRKKKNMADITGQINKIKDAMKLIERY